MRLGKKSMAIVGTCACAILVLTVARSTWSLRRTERLGASGAWHEIERDLDTYYQLRRTLQFFPAHAGFLDGYSFYGLLANPVPREIWPGKPVGVGKLAAILYDHNPNNSLGLSLPGELYANFGYVGALAGMFLFGTLITRIRSWYTRQRGDIPALLVYIMLTSSMMMEVRGDILDATVPLLYQLLPVAVSFALLTRANRRSRKRAAARQSRSIARKATGERLHPEPIWSTGRNQ